MNHLFTRIILFTGASLLFFSCSRESSLSFTKRHYRNGYFVEHAINQPVPKPQTHETDFIEQPSIASQKTTKQIRVERDLDVKNVNTSESKQAVVSKPKSVATERINHKPVNGSIPSFISDIRSKTNTPVHKFQLKHTQQVTDENVRSFFWTVILVILILWLIAVLSGGWGLGGLVHLLLVVALILFILWLLRII